LDGAVHRLTLDDPMARAADLAADSGQLRAPMPGKILKVHVKAGQVVARGQALLVLEAMKMEHTVAAPADGTVSKLRVAEGEQVSEGAELIVFEATT
jgi:3-methylcrotonyl-CoA carboxylase alpha subunit